MSTVVIIGAARSQESLRPFLLCTVPRVPAEALWGGMGCPLGHKRMLCCYGLCPFGCPCHLQPQGEEESAGDLCPYLHPPHTKGKGHLMGHLRCKKGLGATTDSISIHTASATKNESTDEVQEDVPCAAPLSTPLSPMEGVCWCGARRLWAVSLTALVH